jgi:hypothetical protein
MIPRNAQESGFYPKPADHSHPWEERSAGKRAVAQLRSFFASMKRQTRRFQRADDAIQLVCSEYDFDISILSQRDTESHCVSGHADKHNPFVS